MTVEKVENSSLQKAKRADPYAAWHDYASSYDNEETDNDPVSTDKKKKDSPDISPMYASSVMPAATTATQQQDLSKPGQQLSFSTVTDLGKKLWDWICTPITVNNQSTGTSNKPGGDSVSPIGGAPSIEPPILIDKVALQKALKETQEAMYRIQETRNEFGDEIREDERKFIICFKMQNKIREETVVSLKFQLIFDQKKDRTIRKNQSDFELQRIEISKKQKFWGWINTGLTISTVALTVALVAAAVFAAAGVMAIAAGVQTAMAISQAALGIANGGTMFIKAVLDKDQGEFRSKTTSLKDRHIQLTFRIKDEMNLMNDGFNKAMKCFEWLKQVLDNLNRTVSFIHSK